MPNQEAPMFGAEILSPRVMVQETILAIQELVAQTAPAEKYWDIENHQVGLRIKTKEGNYMVTFETSPGQSKITMKRAGHTPYVISYKNRQNPNPHIFLTNASRWNKVKAKIQEPNENLALLLTNLRREMLTDVQEIRSSGFTVGGKYQEVILDDPTLLADLVNSLPHQVTKFMQEQIGQPGSVAPENQPRAL